MAILLMGVGAAAGEEVSYPSGAETVRGELYAPTAKGRHPAIIVIHEWWGLNDFARAKAKKFAADGYVALAVDLYRGKATADPEIAHQLARGLPEDRARRDLRAAFAYLATRPDVDPARIGVVGWCMGGGYALQLAVEEPKLAAAVIYYGRLVTDEKEVAKIRAPLLGNFGADDQGIPATSVRAFKAPNGVDFKVYEGAGHAFASSSKKEVFRPEAAKDADTRTTTFFTRTLKPQVSVP